MILDIENMGGRTPYCIKNSYAIGGAVSTIRLTIDFIMKQFTNEKVKYQK